MHIEGVEFKATELFKLSDIYWIFRNNMVRKQGCVSITSWQHLTWHFITPARHTKSFSYYYLNYFLHVAMLQKFARPLVGVPSLWGPCSTEHAEHA